jgi:hypothetical protein
MMDKCYTKTSPAYPYFGAKGITVCREWRSAEQFIKDVPNNVFGRHIVLKYGEKVFSPSTIDWLTHAEVQNRKWLDGVLTASLLAKRTGYSRERIRQMSTITEKGDKYPVLHKYILHKRIVNSNTIMIYRHSAIEFLQKRRRILYKKEI